ncbi:hypothetical protein PGT21_010876 [Puccinia graminis f. sp. tritici]|uniref:Inner centromere protein ARK-binding domain-containing protein n=1 Tax=Puccinia graminis f. sp. tritici TaxID=56615 RepID=A0A5B0LI05_PUCGR|nr:hypothetical protein PGTUg99_001977 [Puccinia graminis f. sp. tritici]KAA1065341.1 hypothetical protein PGTUg99_024103 [Puccinia graminis f. sp. tritici]KAA1095037.1 hypothetical protein PGT21_034841 [Puccinia graminis f. sp. tritici]KAA1118942.1 hypothetical protein PGT21_010876 [Puccinia graminis f. sp. tritici]
MNPSSHTQPAGSALPDDIRLKCSYYASEIKNQVSSLYDEQHKWLEDHLSEIKETLTKVTEKKTGTRAVMAGIIKTPSRKRTKRVSKKMSKPDQSSSTHPLSELKRSNLNINSKDIQEIINQQLEKEKREIESRLQKELSSLDHPYESPVKKTAGSSNFISADLTNKQPVPSIWNPVDSILPSKIVLSSGLSGSTKTNEDNIFSLSSSSNKKVDHKDPFTIKPLGPFSQQDSELEETEPSHESAADPNDVFAAAGHELSAIQEGEEEEDHHLTEPPPPIPKSLFSTQSTSEVVPPQKLTSSTRLTHSVSASPTHKKLTTPPPQTKTTPTPPQCKSTTPPPQARSPHPQHASANIENLEARVDESHRPAFLSDSPSAPDTNSVDTGVYDSDPIPPQVSHSAKTPDIDNLPGSVSQVATTKLTDLRTSNTKPTPAPLDLLPSNSTAPSTISNVSSAAVNKLLTPEHPASDPASKPTSSASNSEQSQSNHIERFHSSSSHNPTAPMIKQESDEQAQQLPPQEAVPTLPHVDTVVEVPLSDKPSSLRNNLYASIGSSHSDKLPDHQVRTPGEPTGSNLFTPGNPRSAMIRSPHSQWSSKPSGALWTQHKPLKTPAALSNLATAAQSERNKGGLSGSPFEDLSKPVNLLSNLQSTSVQQSAVAETPLASSLAQPIAAIDSQHSRRSGMKRTSTDAGFNHTSDAHDAKMSRSHTPGMMHVRPSTTGATARKGMEDLKSRLSKIQRESAMHERVHHHPSGTSVEAPLNVNPRSSLVTHTNATSFSKALPTATGSTFPINHVAATEKLDRDSTTEIRSHPQDIHRDFSAPIELSASSKIQTAHQLTEPINLQSRVATLEPAASSKAQHKDGPRSGQSPETAANFQNKQTSSSNLIVNMLAADEANSKSLTAEARISPLPTGAQYTGLSSPSEVASVLPATKIETKHLAFLKGAIGASTSPPPSTELEKSTRNPPSGTIDHSVGSDHDDPQPRAGTADEEDEDRQSVASSKLSQPNEMDDQHENSNLSSEDNEDHEKHSEAEDDASNDDDTYGEPSVEIVSSHAKQILTNSDHEQDSRNQQESNVPHPRNRTQSEMTKTPRNVPATPSSPASTGLMGVFKAGAALASSWTATKPKPDRPELKSLQLAAAAAKKEQDERDRKATLKEERRLLAAEKKQAEEKAKAENERKARMAEVEKKKQEREEALKARTTFKVKVPTNHAPPGSRQASMTGDAAKKRKVENESNRTIDPKKAKAPQAAEPHGKIPSSAQKPPTNSYLPTRTAPSVPGSAMKQTSSKAAHAGSSTSTKTKPNPPSRPVSQMSQHSGLPKSTGASQHTNPSQSSHQTNPVNKGIQPMVKGKMREEKVVEDEYIELPDIDSEYSEEDDVSEHERKEAKLPDWAQSPALKEALANQRKVNPDDVFGGTIPPPRMDEIFRGRTSKFRHRTSSANWTGTDGLTAIEEAEYAKRMGYHNKKRSLKR